MRAHVPRADRIPLPTLINYRLTGDDHWLQSRVANMSGSGLLFGPTSLQPGTTVELIISSPIPIVSTAAGRVVCTARIVRTTEAGATAARFEACRLLLES